MIGTGTISHIETKMIHLKDILMRLSISFLAFSRVKLKVFRFKLSAPSSELHDLQKHACSLVKQFLYHFYHIFNRISKKLSKIYYTLLIHWSLSAESCPNLLFCNLFTNIKALPDLSNFLSKWVQSGIFCQICCNCSYKTVETMIMNTDLFFVANYVFFWIVPKFTEVKNSIANYCLKRIMYS